MQQAKVVSARDTLKAVAADLVKEHQNSLAAGEANAQNEGPRKARKGVELGSFIDLMVQSRNRVTGEGLTNASIVQQADSHLALLP